MLHEANVRFMRIVISNWGKMRNLFRLFNEAKKKTQRKGTAFSWSSCFRSTRLFASMEVFDPNKSPIWIPRHHVCVWWSPVSAGFVMIIGPVILNQSECCTECFIHGRTSCIQKTSVRADSHFCQLTSLTHSFLTSYTDALCAHHVIFLPRERLLKKTSTFLTLCS